jgi:DNA-binding NarL/FixJ family response regulator
MSAKTRVLVVEDHSFFRSGLIHWLNQQADLTCCGEADSVAAAHCVVPGLKPDIVLLDIQLPDGDGLELVREFNEAQPPIRVIVLSQSDESAFALRALQFGARGYVMKSKAAETILDAIHAVIGGKAWFSPAVTGRPNQLPDLDDRTTASGAGAA